MYDLHGTPSRVRSPALRYWWTNPIPMAQGDAVNSRTRDTTSARTYPLGSNLCYPNLRLPSRKRLGTPTRTPRRDLRVPSWKSELSFCLLALNNFIIRLLTDFPSRSRHTTPRTGVIRRTFSISPIPKRGTALSTSSTSSRTRYSAPSIQRIGKVYSMCGVYYGACALAVREMYMRGRQNFWEFFWRVSVIYKIGDRHTNTERGLSSKSGRSLKMALNSIHVNKFSLVELFSGWKSLWRSRKGGSDVVHLE